MQQFLRDRHDRSRHQRLHAIFASQGCFDGLAYGPSDDTLWASQDASFPVTHYTTAGVAIGSFSAPAGWGGYGNSGIAVGGANLYMANDGFQQIYVVDKAFTSASLFATFPARLEDMECDNLTFASSGKGAIWSKDAYDNVLNVGDPDGHVRFRRRRRRAEMDERRRKRFHPERGAGHARLCARLRPRKGRQPAGQLGQEQVPPAERDAGALQQRQQHLAGSPVSDFDTHSGSGTGSYNGVDGATIRWILTDAGEPGSGDSAAMSIIDAGGNVVLSVSGPLNDGNHQAHTD